MSGRIRVLIVDDAPVIRQVLRQIISAAPDMEVVGEAENPFDAREAIKRLDPDVLTLDIEMPRMNGIDFLRNLMRLRPMPVVMISTLTASGAPATLEALELGAVDYLQKPNAGDPVKLAAYAEEIQEKIRAASVANINELERRSQEPRAPRGAPVQASPQGFVPGMLIAIGASTGGTEAIKEVLEMMPVTCPPIVITQHIPPVFSTTYAARMDRHCAIRVYEATEGMPIEAGAAYIAPGGFHLRVIKRGAKLTCALSEDDPVNRHRPSVEVLFRSVLDAVGTKCVAAILTGMGADGAAALLDMRKAGCFTVAQDEATSVVWGMPGAAVKIGAAVEVQPLQAIAGRLLQRCTSSKRT